MAPLPKGSRRFKGYVTKGETGDLVVELLYATNELALGDVNDTQRVQ